MDFTRGVVDCLIYRYLQDSAYGHSAFTFYHESAVRTYEHGRVDALPSGTLLQLMQRGLMSIKAELSQGNDGNVRDIELPSIIKAARSTERPAKRIKTLKAKQDRTGASRAAAQPAASEPPSQERSQPSTSGTEGIRAKNFTLPSTSAAAHCALAQASNQVERVGASTFAIPAPRAITLAGSCTAKPSAAQASSSSGLADNSKNYQQGPKSLRQSSVILHDDHNGPELADSRVTHIKEHNVNDTYSCAWHPFHDTLTSVSSDASARSYNFSAHVTVPSYSAFNSSTRCKPTAQLMRHHPFDFPTSNAIAMLLDWNPSGTILLTGSMDGGIRFWDVNGQLMQSYFMHTGPVFALKWSSTCDKILSTGVDQKVLVWSSMLGQILQQFSFHVAPALDVDWLDDSTFVTAGADCNIYWCKLNVCTPLQTSASHTGEVNSVRWSPKSCLLASGSDDKTVKVWNIDQSQCILDLTGHTKEVMCVRWAPIGPQALCSNGKVLLASASLDNTVRIWDINSATQDYLTINHLGPAVCVNFSPNGQLLASGSHGKVIQLHDVRNKQLVNTYKTEGTVNEVSWNSRGDMLGACTNEGSVYMLDLRKVAPNN